MNNYSDKELLTMPFNKNMSDDELENYILKAKNIHCILSALIESDKRKSKRIKQIEHQLYLLEEKAIKKPGRKKKAFYHCGKELTDKDLVDLIDEGYYRSISQMEKELGASKNQLRNRINKERKRQQLEKASRKRKMNHG